MIILGIESSCDESAVSIIEIAGSPQRPRVRALANVVSSQVKLHAKFGGVVPNLAKREHQKNLVPVLLQALRDANTADPTFIYDRKYKLKSGLRVRGAQIKEILEREPELLRRMKRIFRMPAPRVDAIAVTVGPGLAPALWVGINFARALSMLWGKPLIPVNHLEGHIVTNFLQEIRGSSKPEIRNPKQARISSFQNSKHFEFRASKFEFPAIALLVSGGHTELVLMRRRIGGYRVIGETRDDAAGEAFDKVAKMLGLGFPGGPIISKLAERGDPTAFLFPRPMMREENFDFSFSGLKTAVLYTLEKLRNEENKKMTNRKRRSVKNFSFSRFLVSHLCASFQAAVVDVLAAKTVRATKQYRAKTVMLGGGVAANTKLRHDLGAALRRHSPDTQYLIPATSLTGDNALMIALAGYFHRRERCSWKTLRADANLRLDAPRRRN